MAIYVKLPSGAVFARHYGIDYLKFGKTSGIPEINLTEILKKYADSNYTEIDPRVEIFMGQPPADNNIYLKYEISSLGYRKHIRGSKAAISSLQTERYGQFWFNKVPLSDEKREKVDQRRAEQRFDRRTKGTYSV